MFRNWFAKLALIRMRRASGRAAGRVARKRLWRPRFDTLESRDVPSVTAGPEFQVNTFSSNYQSIPSVAADAAGNYVAVWQSNGQDGDGYGIFAQRYAADGTALGGEFPVNTYTTNRQFAPSVAADAAGNFVVAWTSDGQDGDGDGIYAQWYAADGTALGGEFPVNTYTTSSQFFPAVAVDAAGNFVVAWISYGQDGSSYGIVAQRYTTDGTALGGEILVNTYTSELQSYPSVAMDAAGNFVVAWESYGQDGSGNGIYAKRYTVDRVFGAAGGETQVNTTIASEQVVPSVAVQANRGYVATWASLGQDGDQWGVYLQRFADDGSPRGGEVLVNTHTTDSQYGPDIATDAAGNFVITWLSFNQNSSGFGVFAQRYTADGTPQGGEFQVNSITTAGSAAFPSISMDAAGDFVIAWVNSNTGGTHARLFAADGTPRGNQFQVSNSNTGGENVSVVAMNSSGEFVVTWQAYTDSDRDGVFARRFAADGTAQGSQFRANTYTTNRQFIQSVGIDADGDFVIAWQSLNQDGSGYGIYAQRYDGDGTPQGGEFRVNTNTDGNQRYPSVAMNAAGDFIVSWIGGRISAQRYTADGTPIGTEFQVGSGGGGLHGLAADSTGGFVAAYEKSDGNLTGIYAQRYTNTENQPPTDIALSNATIAENAGVNALVGTLTATDPNAGDTATFSLAAGVHDNDLFNLDGTTLRANASFDFETKNSYTVTVTVADSFGQTFDKQFAISVTNVNEAPVIEVFDPKTYVEGSAPVLVTAGASLTDVDSPDFDGGSLIVALTTGALPSDHLTIASTGGTFVVSAPGDGTVRVNGNVVGNVTGGTGIDPLVIAFNPHSPQDFVRSVLRAVSFHNVSADPTNGGANPNRTVTFTIDDGDGGTAMDDKVLTIIGTPKLGGFTSPVSFTEDGGPILLTAAGTVTDADSPDFAGGKLTVKVATGAVSTDRLSIRNIGTGSNEVGFNGSVVSFEGTPVGTTTGGSGTTPLVITFNASATPAIAEAVLQNVTYENVSQNVGTLTRTIRFTQTDGDGGISPAVDVIVNLTRANDAPVVSLSGSSTYTENAAALVVGPLAGLSDVDSPNFASGSLTVTLTVGGLATDLLDIKSSGTGTGQVSVSGGVVSYQGVAIGTVTGGVGTNPLVVAWNASATPVAARAVLRAVTYVNTSDDPTAGGTQPNRTISFAVDDGDGGSGSGSKTIVVKAVNDKPVLGGIVGSANYGKGDPATLVAASATVSDPDSSNFAFGKLTVKSIANGTSSDRLELRNEGTGAGQVSIGSGMVSYSNIVIGTVTGGIGTTPLVVTFNVNASREAVEAVLRSVTYRNTNPNPTVLTRTIRYTLGDGDGGLSAAVDQVLNIV